MRKLALHVDPLDNVATVFFNDCKDGTDVEVSNKDGSIEVIKCIGDVPFGHKIAYTDIKKGHHSSSWFGDTIFTSHKSDAERNVTHRRSSNY